MVTEKQQSEGVEEKKITCTLLTVANFSEMGFLFPATMGGLLQINRPSDQRLYYACTHWTTKGRYDSPIYRPGTGLCRFTVYTHANTQKQNNNKKKKTPLATN